MSIALGTRYTFRHVFTDSSGDAADPTTVKFYLREEVDGTELEWTYDGSAVEGTHYPTGMQPLVKNGTGDYSLAYDARKPERVSGFMLGVGTIFQAAPFTLFVRHAAIAMLDPPSS